MPCCIATLHYLACQHHKLYKLRCTTYRCDPQSICPRKLQHVLVQAKYRWSCEECLRRRYKTEDDERFNTWAAKMKKLADDGNLSEETWNFLVQNTEERIDFVEARLQKARKSQVLEIQRAEKWLRDYASTTLELLYGEEDFDDSDSYDTYDEDESMSGLQEEQPQVSRLDDFPMQDSEPEQQTSGQGRQEEQHDTVMEDQVEISPEPNHNKYKAEKLAKLDSLLLAQKHDLIIIRDASRAVKGQQADAAPGDQPSSSAAASSLGSMPAGQTQTLAPKRGDSPAVPVFRGAYLYGMRAQGRL